MLPRGQAGVTRTRAELRRARGTGRAAVTDRLAERSVDEDVGRSAGRALGVVVGDRAAAAVGNGEGEAGHRP